MTFPLPVYFLSKPWDPTTPLETMAVQIVKNQAEYDKLDPSDISLTAVFLGAEPVVDESGAITDTKTTKKAKNGKNRP